jgi:hypothetical protein
MFHGLKGLACRMIGFTVIVIVAKAGTISDVRHIFQVSFVCALSWIRNFNVTPLFQHVPKDL